MTPGYSEMLKAQLSDNRTPSGYQQEIADLRKINGELLAACKAMTAALKNVAAQSEPFGEMDTLEASHLADQAEAVIARAEA